MPSLETGRLLWKRKRVRNVWGHQNLASQPTLLSNNRGIIIIKFVKQISLRILCTFSASVTSLESPGRREGLDAIRFTLQQLWDRAKLVIIHLSWTQPTSLKLYLHCPLHRIARFLAIVRNYGHQRRVVEANLGRTWTETPSQCDSQPHKSAHKATHQSSMPSNMPNSELHLRVDKNVYEDTRHENQWMGRWYAS